MRIEHEDGYVHVIFPDQQSLARTLCRFQEHYESPKFRGEIFTLGQFREWYCTQRGGWTYDQDWGGFNFPSHNLDAFKKGLFDPLSEDEQAFLELLRYKEGKFYVIATAEDSPSDIVPHEKLHALFYTNPDYREAVINLILTRKEELNDLKDHLANIGYHTAVILDEIQAYLGASTDYLKENEISYPENLATQIRDLAESFQSRKNA